MLRALAFSVLVFFFGCSGINYGVPVTATSSERETMRGTWEGTYEITDNGTRKGHIYFSLSADHDTAIGYVVMSATRYMPRNNPGNVYPSVANEQIPIRLVSAMDGYVRGELESYRDPECGCRLTTTFTGRRAGTRFYGTFVTRHSDTNMTATGKWEAVRIQP